MIYFTVENASVRQISKKVSIKQVIFHCLVVNKTICVENSYLLDEIPARQRVELTCGESWGSSLGWV
jgi:hypothetical protein